MKPACKTCREILEFVISYKQEHDGNSPSFRKIAPAVEVSLATVALHVGHLRRDGLVKKSSGRQKPLELTEEAYQ